MTTVALQIEHAFKPQHRMDLPEQGLGLSSRDNDVVSDLVGRNMNPPQLVYGNCNSRKSSQCHCNE